MTKTWLITGASRGLGRHLARHVLDRGHRVVATARRPEDLDAGYGSQIRTAALDVTDPGAARRRRTIRFPRCRGEQRRLRKLLDDRGHTR
jgi:NAD(P)-dependent dehydrogenase (short-subunit alcohol dehydrogenase family)